MFRVTSEEAVERPAGAEVWSDVLVQVSGVLVQLLFSRCSAQILFGTQFLICSQRTSYPCHFQPITIPDQSKGPRALRGASGRWQGTRDWPLLACALVAARAKLDEAGEVVGSSSFRSQSLIKGGHYVSFGSKPLLIKFPQIFASKDDDKYDTLMQHFQQTYVHRFCECPELPVPE